MRLRPPCCRIAPQANNYKPCESPEAANSAYWHNIQIKVNCTTSLDTYSGVLIQGVAEDQHIADATPLSKEHLHTYIHTYIHATI